MGRLRGRLRRLFRAADEELISIELLDGTVARFSLEAYKECFIHETDRSKAHFIGEEVPPPHPIILALRQAKDLERVVQEHGTMMGHFVVEDAIIRGERERPGPPVRETSPGVYE